MVTRKPIKLAKYKSKEWYEERRRIEEQKRQAAKKKKPTVREPIVLGKPPKKKEKITVKDLPAMKRAEDGTLVPETFFEKDEPVKKKFTAKGLLLGGEGGLFPEGAKTGTLPIGPGAAAKIPKFADAIRKTATSYKAIEKGDVILRNTRQIQRIAKSFKIPFSSAKKIANTWGILSPEKKVSLLTKLPVKTIAYATAGVWGTTGIMTWMSVDNIAQSAAIFVRDAFWAAKTYPESIPEVLEGFEETQAALDLARGATVITTSINPFLWPFKKLISTALDASQRQVDLFRWQIEQMEVPGAEEAAPEEPAGKQPIEL